MASQVEIVNASLNQIGEDVITSIDDNLVRAIAAKNLWPLIRDQVMVDHPWNCAMKRTQLAVDPTAPAWGYAARYLLPTDCLRVWKIKGNPKWKREGRYILTNSGAPLYVLYISQLTDPALFDPYVAQGISNKLAARLAFRIQKNASLQAQIEEIYRNELRDARSIDAQEGDDEDQEENAFLDARR